MRAVVFRLCASPRILCASVLLAATAAVVPSHYAAAKGASPDNGDPTVTRTLKVSHPDKVQASRKSASQGPVLLAQAPDAPAATPAPGGDTGAAPGPNSLVTLTARDVPIQDVLKALADQTHTNIATAAGVAGNVSIAVRNVTIDQALDLITKLNKLAYVHDPATNTIIVGTPDQIRQIEPVEAPAIIQLNHAAAADIAAAITKNYPDVTITPTGTSSLTISGPRDHVTAAEQLIEALDKAAPIPPAAIPVQQAVISLQFLTTTDVVTTLSKVYPQLTIIGESNRQLLLSGTQNDVQNAQQLLKEIDTAPASASAIKTVVYEARHADVTELARILAQQVPDVEVVTGPGPGFNSGAAGGAASSGSSSSSGGAAPSGGASSAGSSVSSGASGGGGASGGSSAPSGGGGGSAPGGLAMRTSLLLLTGAPDRITAALAVLNQVDLLPPQILLEAKVIDLNLEHMQTIGINWSFSSGFQFGESQPTGTSSTGTGGTTGSGTATNFQPIFPFVSSPLGRSFITATVDLLANDSHNKILANPKLIAESDRPANIFIGDEIHYVSNVSVATTGTNVTTATANVGINLSMLAHVDPTGLITLNVNPDVSVLTQFVAGSAGSQLPLISKRTAQTVMRIASGQTIAIGGLIRDQDLNAIQKVPLLGDLPFFGQLFRHRATTHQRSEVVIFIRATVLPQPAASAVPQA